MEKPYVLHMGDIGGDASESYPTFAAALAAMRARRANPRGLHVLGILNMDEYQGEDNCLTDEQNEAQWEEL